MSAPLIIPHSDGAGDIDRVGPGVVNRIGERVWVWNGQWRRPYGTAAEYIVLPSAQAVLLPKHIGYAEGACFGISALTALQAVRLAELSPASTVIRASSQIGWRNARLNRRRQQSRVSLLPSADLTRRHMLAAPAQTRSSIIEPKMSVSALRH
jgi:NADPH2:quinone reductase